MEHSGYWIFLASVDISHSPGQPGFCHKCYFDIKKNKLTYFILLTSLAGLADNIACVSATYITNLLLALYLDRVPHKKVVSPYLYYICYNYRSMNHSLPTILGMMMSLIIWHHTCVLALFSYFFAIKILSFISPKAQQLNSSFGCACSMCCGCLFMNMLDWFYDIWMTWGW